MILNNAILDQRLIDRKINIRRLDDIIDARTPISFQCLANTCHYIWKASPDNISRGKSCPSCCGNLKLTNDIVDKKLSHRPIKRLGNVLGNKNKIEFSCKICLYSWSACPDSILNQGSSCPSCAKNIPLDNKIVDQRLPSNIKRLENYININIPINFQCLDCKYVWNTSTTSILNNGTGCQQCSIRKNQRIIFDILKTNNLLFESEKYLKNIYNIDNNIHIDFYLPYHNIIIEYNGAQHYRPVRFGGMSKEAADKQFITYQQPRDAIVQNFCNTHNIKLIWIDGRKYTNQRLIKYMTDIIIPSIQQ